MSISSKRLWAALCKVSKNWVKIGACAVIIIISVCFLVIGVFHIFHTALNMHPIISALLTLLCSLLVAGFIWNVCEEYDNQRSLE